MTSTRIEAVIFDWGRDPDPVERRGLPRRVAGPGGGRAPHAHTRIGHTEGHPDAIVTSLAEVPDVVRRLDAS